MYVVAQPDVAAASKTAVLTMPPEILVCRCVAAAVIIPLFIPALHKPLRSLLRPGAVFHAERGLEWVVFAQKHQNRFVTAAANWSCATVTVVFYATFLPILVWVGIPELGWRLVFLMAGCLYIGNALKDLVSAPRPTGIKSSKGSDFRPKLITSNAEAASYALEYGMPSTHTMNSLVLNGYAVYYLLQRDYIQPEAAPYCYAAVIAWTLWIGVARIYMGMHTPIDIAGGLAAGVVTLGAYISVDNVLDRWILNGPHVGAVMLLACAVLLRLHPLPLIYTPSYEFSVSFAGVAFGTATGLRRAKHLHIAGALLPVLWRQGGALAVVRRLALGFFIMISATTLAKKVMLRVLPPIYRLYPPALRRLWQPPMHTLKEEGELGIPVNAKGVPWDVDVTARFFGYSMIGFPLTELIPRVFDLLQW